MDHPAFHRHKGRGDQGFKALLPHRPGPGPARHGLPAVGQHLGRVVERVAGIGLQPGRGPDIHRHRFGPRPQLGRQPPAPVVLDQAAGELLFHLLRFLAPGQQKPALHLHQPGRHLDETAGNVRLPGSGHHRRVLVDEVQNRDVVQVHLVGLDQGQQQFQRAVEVRQMEGQFRHPLHPRSNADEIGGVHQLIHPAGPPHRGGPRPGWTSRRWGRSMRRTDTTAKRMTRITFS